MSIRAFLGHSFTEDDRDLVTKVTAFLDAQKIGHPDFEWVHATQAIPTGVVEKVLPLIRASDIFIGLCTKKERVISPEDLECDWWRPRTLHASTEKFSWKTSDWIIQEIGIAIERGVKLILLLEDGVRKPGGLIGDLEYISFSRTDLAPAFTSLTQMLGGTFQKTPSSLGVSDPPQQKTSAQEKPLEADASTDHDFFKPPQTNWNYDDYKWALFHGICFEKKEYEDQIFQALLDSPLNNSAQSADKWAATRESFQITLDFGGSLGALEKLVNKDRSNHEMVAMLARAHVHLGNRDIGALIYEEAARAAANSGARIDQARLLSSAIEEYISIGQNDKVSQVLDTLLSFEPTTTELEGIKLRCLDRIATSQNKTAIRIAALERCLALEPGDIDTRFNLAFLYGDIGDHEASLHHYQAIPEPRRTEATWNNIGVARGRVNLKFSATDAYKKAEALGNTLAMSNLAQNFLKAGFAKEAEALCTTALSKGEYDPRVPETLAQLKSEIKEEIEKEAEVIKQVSPRTLFLKDAGQSMTMRRTNNVPTHWSSPTGSLTFSIVGDQVTIEGAYESKGGLGLIGFGINTTPSQYSITYHGTACGHVFFVEVLRKKIGETTTRSIFSEDKPVAVVMILSEDARKLRVMEGSGSGAKFYEITAF